MVNLFGKNIKGVIFDLDGTLLDVYRIMSRSIHEKSLVEP